MPLRLLDWLCDCHNCVCVASVRGFAVGWPLADRMAESEDGNRRPSRRGHSPTPLLDGLGLRVEATGSRATVMREVHATHMGEWKVRVGIRNRIAAVMAHCRQGVAEVLHIEDPRGRYN